MIINSNASFLWGNTDNGLLAIGVYRPESEKVLYWFSPVRPRLAMAFV